MSKSRLRKLVQRWEDRLGVIAAQPKKQRDALKGYCDGINDILAEIREELR